MLNASGIMEQQKLMELQKLAGMENFKKLTIPQYLEREKLIELLKDGGVRDFPFVAALADRIIANGVTISVRCKDCRDCEIWYPEKQLDKEATQAWFCKRYKRYRKPDDFCSYGERKE